jgi:hypothetical protein
VGGELREAELAGPLEGLVDGEPPLEDEVPAPFDLLEEVAPAQVHGLTFAPGELRPEHDRPIIEPLADNLRTKEDRRWLDQAGVGDVDDRVVVIAERDPGSGEHLFDEGMSIEVVGVVKGVGRWENAPKG